MGKNASERIIFRLDRFFRNPARKADLDVEPLRIRSVETGFLFEKNVNKSVYLPRKIRFIIIGPALFVLYNLIQHERHFFRLPYRFLVINTMKSVEPRCVHLPGRDILFANFLDIQSGSQFLNQLRDRQRSDRNQVPVRFYLLRLRIRYHHAQTGLIRSR